MSINLVPLFELLEFQTELGHWFGTLPFKFVWERQLQLDLKKNLGGTKVPFPVAAGRTLLKQRKVLKLAYQTRAFRLWNFIMIPSLCVSLLETYLILKICLGNSQTLLHHLTSLAFQIYHLILTSACYLHFCNWYQFADELCLIVNNLMWLSRKLKNNSRDLSNNGNAAVPEGLVVLGQVGALAALFIVPLGAIPVISVIKPEVHLFLQGTNLSLLSRGILFAVNCARTAIVPLAGGFTLALGIINLLVIQMTVGEFSKLVQKHGKVKVSRSPLMFYRELQVLQLLTNGYAQRYILPTVQFHGHALNISLLYSVLAFWKHLDWRIIGGILTILSFEVLAQQIFYEFASSSYDSTKGVVAFLKRENWRDPYVRKFCASCKPISLKVGMFHEINRRSWPYLLRYCSQRTIFMLKATPLE